MSEGTGIVLVGLPGSGKTAVGRCVAERLGRPFVDLDEAIEQKTGRSPAEHIARDGETAFRTVEQRTVARLADGGPSIIATGGGAVIDPLNRWAFAEHGSVVWLDVSIDRALARLRSDPVERPLLAGDAERRLETLASERAPFYRASDFRIEAEGTPESVAQAVAVALADRSGASTSSWRTLFDTEVPRGHPFGPTHARIVFGRGLDRAALGAVLDQFDGRAPAVIADASLPAALPALDASLPRGRRMDLAGSEGIKRMAHLERVLEWLSDEGVERGDPLVAVGGGTVGDLAGVAAAIYLRGIPLVHLPTTWVAMCDSAIGGKTAVDLEHAKNAAGAFWPAWAIVADVEALGTLPVERARDGMAESLKCGLIGDPELWALVETRGLAAMIGVDDAARYAIVERAARLKLDVVERDPFERGGRRALNLGHTLAHALEVESGYSLAHGVAVGLGLRAVAAIAAGRGADPDLADRIDAVLAPLGFPFTRAFDVAAVREALRGDKKRERGVQRWVLPMATGRVEDVNDVTEAELDRAIARILAPS